MTKLVSQFTHSVMSDSATPWTAAHQASLSITNSQSLLKLMSIMSVMPFNHLILCRPLLLLPSIFPSIRVFSSVSVLRTRWPKYWSFSSTISPSNDYSKLISFRMDWLDLPAVQGTLKSLLQHHSSKVSILWHSAFFIVQLSHPYLTTGKTIALSIWTFVDKVMSLLFNMLSRLFIAFLPRSKHLLISWLHSPSAVILEPKKIKPVTVSIVSPSICHEVMGPNAMIFIWFLNVQFLNLDRVLKSRDITLPTKVCLLQTMVFLVVMYVCESWTIKKAEHQRIDVFELWYWRILLRVTWAARRSNQSIQKEMNAVYPLEGLMLKLKL